MPPPLLPPLSSSASASLDALGLLDLDTTDDTDASVADTQLEGTGSDAAVGGGGR